MAKKVVGMLGSPRRGGNNEILLDRVLEGAKSAGSQIEKIILNELNIKPCQDCGGCSETGICIVKDDFQKIYEKLKSYQYFVIASPVYFYGTSAQVKLMIDRSQCCWTAKYKLKKPVALPSVSRRGIFISTRGKSGLEGFRCSLRQIKAFFTVNNIEYFSKILFAGADEKGKVSRDDEILEFARSEGINMIKL